jgi:hypothetical protein
MELREALESAVDEAEAAAPPAETSAPISSLEEASSVVNDDTPETPAPEKVAEPAVEKPPAESKPDKAPAAPETPAQKAEAARQHRIDRPPQSWKKEAKGEWAALSLQTRQEIHRREMEIDQALKQSAPDRQLAEQFKQTLQPFMPRIQASGFSPIDAARSLFEADRILSSAPQHKRAEYMADLILQYGIDITALDSALAPRVHGNPQGPTPAGSPQDIAVLVQQQLQQALAPFLQERDAAKQAQTQQVVSEVENMGLDPKYPMFDEVRLDMADLIKLNAERGVYLSLDEAYTRSVRMNPNTFGQLERQSTVTSAQSAHQAALRARAAASSVSGAPAGGGGQSNSGDGSLRGAIEAAFGGMRV